MTETNGLQAVAETTGPLHALESPPHPDDFEIEHDYRAAHEAWVRRSQWTSHTGHADQAPRTAGHADGTRHDQRSTRHE